MVPFMVHIAKEQKGTKGSVKLTEFYHVTSTTVDNAKKRFIKMDTVSQTKEKNNYLFIAAV